MRELLSAKEIADKLGRHVSYVYAMKHRGFPMPGGRSTIGAALAWLVRNPHPKGGKPVSR